MGGPSAWRVARNARCAPWRRFAASRKRHKRRKRWCSSNTAKVQQRSTHIKPICACNMAAKRSDKRGNRWGYYGGHRTAVLLKSKLPGGFVTQTVDSSHCRAVGLASGVYKAGMNRALMTLLRSTPLPGTAEGLCWIPAVITKKSLKSTADINGTDKHPHVLGELVVRVFSSERSIRHPPHGTSVQGVPLV